MTAKDEPVDIRISRDDLEIIIRDECASEHGYVKMTPDHIVDRIWNKLTNQDDGATEYDPA